jgi:hypothetical protein
MKSSWPHHNAPLQPTCEDLPVSDCRGEFCDSTTHNGDPYERDFTELAEELQRFSLRGSEETLEFCAH